MFPEFNLDDKEHSKVGPIVAKETLVQESTNRHGMATRKSVRQNQGKKHNSTSNTMIIL